MILTYNTKEFVNLLENLLTMTKGSKFIWQTYEVPYKVSAVKERFETEFTGNMKVVQKKIFEWLGRRVND